MSASRNASGIEEHTNMRTMHRTDGAADVANAFSPPMDHAGEHGGTSPNALYTRFGFRHARNSG